MEYNIPNYRNAFIKPVFHDSILNQAVFHGSCQCRCSGGFFLRYASSSDVMLKRANLKGLCLICLSMMMQWSIQWVTCGSNLLVSNEKKPPACLWYMGDENSYPVMWGLFHKP